MLNLKQTKATYSVTDTNLIKLLNAFDNIAQAKQDFNDLINSYDVDTQLALINQAVKAKRDTLGEEAATLFMDAIKSRAKRKSIKWNNVPEGKTVGQEKGVYKLKNKSMAQQKPKKEVKKPLAKQGDKPEQAAMVEQPEQAAMVEQPEQAAMVANMPLDTLLAQLLQRDDIADIAEAIDAKLLKKEVA